MVGNIGAQVALLAFALAIVAGLCAGNSPATVLTRALVAMFVALVVGRLAGWTTRLVLRDHFQRRKVAIDQEHARAAEPSTLQESSEQAPRVETG